LHIRRLAGSLGARIEGLDLERFDDSARDQLVKALHEHLVVVVPGPVLSPDALLRVARGLGEPQLHPVVPHIEGHPGVIEIRNFGKRLTLNEHWHSDVTFAPRPPAYTLLQAHRVPEVGGDTQFADQVSAFEELSPAMQRLLLGLRAVHSGAALARAMGREAPEEVVHPAVRTHPGTGRRALYVCRAFTRRFEGMTAEESRPLLEFLYEWGTRPHLTARVRWSPGDLVVWDNRCVLHYAIHDHGDEERVLQRVTVEGETPA